MRSTIIRQNGDVKCTPRIDQLQYAMVRVSVRKRLGLGRNGVMRLEYIMSK